MTAPLTAAYGDFIGALKYKALPANAVAVIKQGFIDCIGVMLRSEEHTSELQSH